MKGAAIAYGMAFTGLLLALALLGAAGLWPSVNQSVTAGLQAWLPGVEPSVTAAIAQIKAEWGVRHRWWLFIFSGIAGLGVWLRVVGLTQHILRSDGDLASHLVPSMRQRSTTAMMAITSAALILLAVGFVVFTVPQPGGPSGWMAAVKGLLAQGLRWSLATSTIAFAYGLLYRSSQKSSARSNPILPGTFLATLVWLVIAVVMKRQLTTLATHHWLYGVSSTMALGMLGLYLATLGLLTGGQYNKLVHRYFPKARSPLPPNQVPPPSFDSFTIQKPPYRR